MMRLFRLLALPVVCCLFALTPAQYPLTWSTLKDLGQLANETPVQLTPAPGGGFFACGTDEGSTILTKINSSGVVSWTKIAPGSFSDMAANSIGIATISFVGWLTDRSFNSHFSNYNVITRYDLAGNVLWTQWVPDSGGSSGQHVGIDSSGNVIVTLQSANSQELWKFDSANGNQSIDMTLTNSPIDAQTATDSTNAIYVAEQTSAYPDPDNATLFKYSPTGALLWSRSLTQGRAPRVAVDSSDNVYLIFNFLYGSGNQVYKYDSNGNLIWNTTSSTPANVKYFALSSTGAVLLGNSDMGPMNATYIDSAGTVQWSQHIGDWGGPVYFDSANNPYAVYSKFPAAQITKFDLAGKVIWTNSRPLGSQQSDGYGMHLAVDSTGSAAMLIPTPPEPSQDLGIYAFNSNGNSLWNVNFDAHRTFDRAWDSVTDSSGNTYVSAIAQGSTNPCAIIKYSTNGSVNWSRVLPQLTGAGRILTPRLTGDGVVVGQTYYMTNTGDPTGLSVHRFDAAGNQLWSYTSVGPEDLKDVEVAGDGSVYLSIQKQSNQFQVPPYSLRVKKLNSSGQLVWTADRPGQINRYQQWSKLAIDANENAYVSFPTIPPNFFFESPTITKIDANGNILWSVVPVLAAHNTPLPGDDLALDSTGNPYLLVSDSGGPETLYKYDPTGAFIWGAPLDVLWSRSYLCIDSFDNIFVGGFDYSINSQGPEIQKLDMSGNRLWAKYFPWYTPHTIFRMLPDGAGGVYFGVQNYSVYPAVGTRFTHLLTNGVLAWPSSGGSFIGGTIYYPAGQMQDEFAGLGIDALGDVFISSSVYGSSGSYDVDVKKYAASNSAFTAQSLATSMSAGETYQATVTVQNTGLYPWTKAASYKLSVMNGSTWGVSSVALNSTDSIAPGQSKVFKFSVYAPTIGGTYNFQCKMYRNTTSFGPLSAAVPIVVTVYPYAARYVSEVVPTTVPAGSTFSVTVDMRNVGTKIWTKAAGFALAPVAGEPSWGVSSIPLDVSDSISQGADKVFTFKCTAPGAAGSYTMRWQMKAGANYFGDRTISKTIVVTP